MSFKTPLGRVRGLGSAKSGVAHFWRQRLTAIANVPLVIAFVAVLIGNLGKPHDEIAASVASLPVAILFVLFIANGAYHMHLGMQVIIEDYVHGEGARIAAIVGNSFFCVLIAAAGIFAILKLSFGG
jgi:succinate dehydrogenase / fumarate reductase membrane anchor subunit